MNSSANVRRHHRVVEAPIRRAALWVGPDLAGAGLSGMLSLMGLDLDAAAAGGAIVGARSLRAGAALFHEGQEARVLYLVRSGQFKLFRTHEDGYEQVLGFPGRGEWVGCMALAGGAHSTSAVALERTSVYELRVADLAMLGRCLPAFTQRLLAMLGQALAERAELTDLMAAVASDVRLARFLEQCAAKAAGRGQSPCRLRLAMSRRDIGSYLGLAHETISRALRSLGEAGLIQVDQREVEILDPAALARFALSTRRKGEVRELHGGPAVGARGQREASSAIGLV